MKLPISIKTRVVTGRGRGRKIGVPTINCAIPRDFPVAHGIYAGWVFDGKKYPAAIHYGPRPQFDETDVSLEAHILDHVVHPISDLVGLELVGYIRDVCVFDTLDAMRVQIESDIRVAKSTLCSVPSEHAPHSIGTAHRNPKNTPNS